MEKELIDEVRKKKEFGGLPDSVVVRALEKGGGDVKEARNFLRKYFGVFLTNKVLRGRDLLGSHFSSRKRDYQKFYGEIFECNGIIMQKCDGTPRKVKGSATRLSSRGNLISRKRVSVLDLGCGVNGFSCGQLERELGAVSYVGVEAAGQLVDFMNDFFKESGFDGEAIKGDLMDLGFVGDVLRDGFDVCFLFQVVDALESVEKDFSKRLISLVMERVGFLVLSLSLVSLGGRKRIGAEKRKWLMDWLGENYNVEKDFEMFGERVVCVKNRE